nr:hypothetical protein [Cytophagales bacterium]
MLTNPTIIPFNSIGLCFSGGGYRASAFSAGVLSYLNRVRYGEKKLLENVTGLSTVSGGTITGAYFAACQAQGIPFSVFFESLYSFLYDDKLMKTALSYMEDDSVWDATPKKRSLINAFSLAYQTLLATGTMDELDHIKDSNLKYVCFNATDFSFGLAFRFQNHGLFGNYRLYCEEIIPFKGSIRIADAIASSSCFPMGFEPIIFPDDFRNKQPENVYKDLKGKFLFVNGVGIMDGGIVDNQGIGSIVNFNNSNAPGTPFDLIMVNDVGSYMMPPWMEDQKEVGPKGNKSLEAAFSGFIGALRFNRWYLLTLITGLLLILGNSMELFFGRSWSGLYITGGVLTGIGLVLSGFGLFTSLSAKFLTYTVQNVFRRNIPGVLLAKIQGLDKLSISLWRRMITERITSTFTMVSYIFLNQLRRINYDFLYENPSNKHRIITNTVYELNGQHQNLTKSAINKDVLGNDYEKIEESALIASQMPTTLWWDEVDIKLNRQDNLIACGQFTTCYNLLKYINELPEPLSHGADIQRLKLMLEADWKKFKDHPRFFIEEIKATMKRNPAKA